MKKISDQQRAERFWKKVKIGGQDECWEWQAGRVNGSYGHYFDSERHVLAHRFAYEVSIGPIPDGLIVRHSCDNPPCCNPDHLLIGTDLDNSKDCISRGRRVDHIGEDHGMALLTNQQIIEIRSKYQEGGITQEELGEMYGVSKPTIGHIIRRETWRHI